MYLYLEVRPLIFSYCCGSILGSKQNAPTTEHQSVDQLTRELWKQREIIQVCVEESGGLHGAINLGTKF